MIKPDRKTLAKHGLKYSKNRMLILEILSKNSTPMSAEQIYDCCRECGSLINISTVYRVLKAFVDVGLSVRTLLEIDDKALYELSCDEHTHHLMCISCNAIVPISGCPLDLYQKELENKFNYDITSHRLEMYGYCDKCRKYE